MPPTLMPIVLLGVFGSGPASMAPCLSVLSSPSFGCSRTHARSPPYLYDSWPYLLRYGANRTTWLNCAANGAFAYQLCGDVVAAAAADFPRSVNVWVMADGPPAKYNGYAFAGGSATDPLQGHVGLIWQVLSTGEHT